MQVSYIKAVDYFMLTSFGFIFAALVEYIIVLNIPNKMADCCTFLKKKEKDDIAKARVSNIQSIMKFLNFKIHANEWNLFNLIFKFRGYDAMFFRW